MVYNGYGFWLLLHIGNYNMYLYILTLIRVLSIVDRHCTVRGYVGWCI